MSEQSDKADGVSFLGLTIGYPRTFWGLLFYVFLLAAAVLIVDRLKPHPTTPRRLWVPAVVDKNGMTVLGETWQMNFWTPSIRTKDNLTSASQSAADPDKWQILSNDEPVLQFGGLLHSNASVFGYRRTEVWGHGRSSFKAGWWWTVNVATNFSAVDLGQIYQKYWKCSGPVFIEVVENRGSE